MSIQCNVDWTGICIEVVHLIHRNFSFLYQQLSCFVFDLEHHSVGGENVVCKTLTFFSTEYLNQCSIRNIFQRVATGWMVHWTWCQMILSFLPSCYVLPNLNNYKSIKKLRVTSGMCLFTSNIIAQSSAAVMINLQAILR